MKIKMGIITLSIFGVSTLIIGFYIGTELASRLHF